MNIKAKTHPVTSFDSEAKMSGVGATALWDGPLDTTAYPKGKGSSSGANGIKLRFDQPISGCVCTPITAKAKR
tara:strand:+ start:198 stop:416 length:219 start_codon:yes stop_codon:yes gene_type:complete